MAGQTQRLRPSRNRIEAIDVVRGAALFGVLTVNLMTQFRVSIFTQFLPGTLSVDLYDVAVERFVEFALESKAFALFSLLFGIGLAIQFERLTGSGRVDYFLTRRLLALLALGLFHLVFIWNGDILTEYAVAGFVVLPFLRLPPAGLGKAAAVFLLVFFALAFFPQPIRLPDSAALQRHVDEATQVYATASYAEILAFSLKESRLLLPLHLNVLPRTVALMLLGACIWKSGVLRDTEEYAKRIQIFAMLATVLGLLRPSFSHWATVRSSIPLRCGLRSGASCNRLRLSGGWRSRTTSCSRWCSQSSSLDSGSGNSARWMRCRRSCSLAPYISFRRCSA
jgi:uncharacterized protein